MSVRILSGLVDYETVIIDARRSSLYVRESISWHF
jgi:hypothetical protein